MKSYRVRLIPFGSAVSEEREIECPDDGEALISSHALLAYFHAAETWQGDRLVCRVTRTGSPLNAAPKRGRVQPASAPSPCAE